MYEQYRNSFAKLLTITITIYDFRRGTIIITEQFKFREKNNNNNRTIYEFGKNDNTDRKSNLTC